jgi:hypothetical protein
MDPEKGSCSGAAKRLAAIASVRQNCSTAALLPK